MPLQQYHERAEKLKETYQAYLASRKAETTPTEEPVVSPTAVETRTLAEATPTTQQTSQVDLTTGAEPAAEGTVGGQTQSVAPPSAPPPALSTHKLVVGPCLLNQLSCCHITTLCVHCLNKNIPSELVPYMPLFVEVFTLCLVMFAVFIMWQCYIAACVRTLCCYVYTNDRVFR